MTRKQMTVVALAAAALIAAGIALFAAQLVEALRAAHGG
jgi:hypothetical protein